MLARTKFKFNIGDFSHRVTWYLTIYLCAIVTMEAEKARRTCTIPHYLGYNNIQILIQLFFSPLAAIPFQDALHATYTLKVPHIISVFLHGMLKKSFLHTEDLSAYVHGMHSISAHYCNAMVPITMEMLQ